MCKRSGERCVKEIKLPSMHCCKSKGPGRTRGHVTIRQPVAEAGQIPRQLILLSITWIFYGASFVATNFYIAYWLTIYKASPRQRPALSFWLVAA